MNYHIGRFVLGLLCVGDFLRMGLSCVRVAGFSLQHGHYSKPMATQSQAPDDGYINVRNISLQHGHYSNPVAAQSETPDDGYINVRNLLST